MIAAEGKFGQVTEARCESLECQGKLFELQPLGSGKPWTFKEVSETIKESFRKSNLSVIGKEFAGVVAERKKSDGRPLELISELVGPSSGEAAAEQRRGTQTSYPGEETQVGAR